MRIGRRRALVLVAALGAAAGWVAVVTTIGDRGSTAGVPRDSERSTGTTIATADAHVAPSALAVPEAEAARASVGEQNSVASRSSECTAYGSFVLPSGFPLVPGAWIEAWFLGDDPLDPRVPGRAHRRHMCDGANWRFDGLPAGVWTFVATAGEAPRAAHGVTLPVVLEPGVDTGPIAIALHEFGLRGRVTDSTGAPLEGIAVTWALAGEEEEDSTNRDGARSYGDTMFVLDRARMVFGGSLYRGTSSTDAAGTFQVPVPCPTSVDLYVAPVDRVPQSRTVAVTHDERRVDAEFALLRMASVHGILQRDDGGPLEGIQVSVLPRAGRPVMGPRVGEVRSTDDSGAFRQFGFEPGTHLLRAGVEADDGSYRTLSASIELSEGDGNRFEGVLERVPRVMGRVVGPNGIHGGVAVLLRGAEDGEVADVAKADAAGWFVLGRLFEREYVLDVHGHELVETRTLDVDMDAVEIDVGDLVVK